MESEPSWVMLALALCLVLALTSAAAWLAVTEARAVRPAPATVRPGRRGLRPRPAGDGTASSPGTGADGREVAE